MISKLIYWIAEREAIRIKKERGDPWPLTDDPILREWSFCNVRREDDKVTRWLAANWREPRATEPDLWFAMVVARFVNWPDTLAEIGFPVPWESERFLAVMAARGARGATRYGSAYMIHADNAKRRRPTPQYQCEDVFAPLWEARERVRPRTGDTLKDFFGRLSWFSGMGGGFMPAQVVADMKYVPPLSEAADWWTWAASGPGSRRGLNRVLGRPVDAKWNEADWRAKLRELNTAIAPELDSIELHAQDLQNCLCEVDKYLRVSNGEGKPKRRYRAAPAPLSAIRFDHARPALSGQ